MAQKRRKKRSNNHRKIKTTLILVKRGANLYDPETSKTAIAKQTWSNGRKNNAVDAYSSFLKMVGGTWEAPLYQTSENYPSSQKKPKSTNSSQAAPNAWQHSYRCSKKQVQDAAKSGN